MDKTDLKLSLLFDFQKFARNQNLQEIIEECLDQDEELTEDNLSQVSAAGEIRPDGPKTALHNFGVRRE